MRQKGFLVPISLDFPLPVAHPKAVSRNERARLNMPFLEAPRSAHTDDAPSRAIWRVLEQSVLAGKFAVFEEAP